MKNYKGVLRIARNDTENLSGYESNVTMSS
jgi:hypothetical protein